MVYSNPEVEQAKELAEAIDRLLALRQQEVKAGKREGRKWHFPNGDYEVKKYTVSQCRKIYGSFMELKRGELKSPPPRSVVMTLADYLDCKIEERNHLLRICQYALVPEYETGNRLKKALQLAGEELQVSPYPGYVITRDWDIHIVNEHVLRLINMSIADFRSVERERRNIIQIIFDPELGIRNTFEVSRGAWETVARLNIYGYKHQNMFAQEEDWYQERVERWHKLPDFSRLWNEVDLEIDKRPSDELSSFPLYITTVRTTKGIVRFRSNLATLGNESHPQVVTYTPCDDESRTVYQALGFTLPPTQKIYQ